MEKVSLDARTVGREDEGMLEDREKENHPQLDLGLPRYTYSRTANVESLYGDEKKAAE